MSDGVYLWFLLQNEITITAQQYVNLIQVAIAQGFHLFPFRTEKLSLVTPMVLRHSGRVGSRRFDWSLRTWRSSGGFFFVSTCGSGHSCLGKRREIEQAGLKARLTEKRKMIIAPLCKLSVCLHLLLLYRKRIIRVYIIYTYDNKTGEILEHKYPINRLCNDSIIEHI